MCLLSILPLMVSELLDGQLLQWLENQGLLLWPHPYLS